MLRWASTARLGAGYLRSLPPSQAPTRKYANTFAFLPLFSRCQFSSNYSTGSNPRRMSDRVQSTALLLSAFCIACFSASYLAVPLYRMFCQVTGYGGTVKDRSSLPVKELAAKQSNKSRGQLITVNFNADTSAHLAWRFTPCQSSVKIRPGETALAFFTAHNPSDKPMVGIATYNVTPMKAGVYFNKIQCFCFEEQRLLPGETIDMPVFFFIDPEFTDDHNVQDVTNLTLSYTFWPAQGYAEGEKQSITTQ